MSPSVSVVVASRGRPADLARAVPSILGASLGSLQLVVVEQRGPEGVWADLPPDERLTHVKLDSVGKCAALNVGVSLATADLVFFTDDDCIVSTEWLARGVKIFREHPNVGAVFSPLVAAPHDPATEWVPTFEPTTDKILYGNRALLSMSGAGANFAARRSVLAQTGKFDERLGPGTGFNSLEEFDYFYRMVRLGNRVMFDSTNPVEHWGKRQFHDGSASRLLRGYWRGQGAVLAKNLKCGEMMSLARLARETADTAVRAVRSVITTGRPSGVLLWYALVKGFAEGLTHPVDRRSSLFR